VKTSSPESRRAASKFTFPHLTMNSATAAFRSNSPSLVSSSSPTSSQRTYTVLRSRLTPSPSWPVTGDASPCATIHRRLEGHHGRQSSLCFLHALSAIGGSQEPHRAANPTPSCPPSPKSTATPPPPVRITPSCRLATPLCHHTLPPVLHHHTSPRLGRYADHATAPPRA
jgi:hypothetical protein